MSPEERNDAIQTLAGRATHDSLAAAPLLWAAHDEKDWARLGLESWRAYLDSVGVSPSQDSKMRKAYSVFGSSWGGVLRSREVTLERLYAAARVTLKEGLTVYDGFSLAEALPASEIIARLRGEQLEPTLCSCPECGASHKRKEPSHD